MIKYLYDHKYSSLNNVFTNHNLFRLKLYDLILIEQFLRTNM